MSGYCQVGICAADQVAAAQLASAWLVQLPLAVYFAYYSSWTQGVQGFMWASASGSLVRLLLLGFFTYRVNWDKQHELALCRNYAEAT